MAYETKVLLEGLTFPEGPRWHDNRLWFSDINDHKIIAVDMDGGAEIVVEVPEKSSGLGWLPDGRLLLVSVDDNKLKRLDSDGLTEIADLNPLGASYSNDMVVDSYGRAYIGYTGYDFGTQSFVYASIIMVTPEGDAKVVATNMALPNGTVVTPDGHTLIVAETMDSCLTAFDIQPDGALTNRRIWAQLSEGPVPKPTTLTELIELGQTYVLPDGICLDAEGAIWVANPFGREVIRVIEGGQVTDRVRLSAVVTACMLGGSERRTLFITIPRGADTEGRIEMVEVEVPGAGLP
ncbi:MAG: SMP-30/gluconolactonase/LRE family protein [Dehalococcoidales bacterium]|nr:MAG: SMP-30/gluconolactonase/LRE family protein [Dehalococcoidales bacterium]